MDLKLAQQRVAEEELNATTEGVHQAHIDGRLQDLHTGLPGILISFDSTALTAQVQPAIKRIYLDAGAVTLPPLVDCPVYIAGGKGGALTIPPKADDDCWLAFSERAIDYWWANGGVQLPADMRMHDYSDCAVFVGMRSQKSLFPMLAPMNMTAIELRDQAGTVVVRLFGGPAPMVSLGETDDNSAPPLIAPLNGVLTGMDMDPFFEVPFFALGAGSTHVVARGKI
jgi:hypothetical protein